MASSPDSQSHDDTCNAFADSTVTVGDQRLTIWDELRMQVPPKSLASNPASQSAPETNTVLQCRTNNNESLAIATPLALLQLANLSHPNKLTDASSLPCLSLTGGNTLYSNSGSTLGFPNSDALKSFRIPKKPNSTVTATLLLPSPSPPVHSNATAEDSLCVRRYHAGAPTNPFSLSFSLDTSDGHSWRSSDLDELWCTVVSELAEQRAKLNLPFISYEGGCT